jgi:hypothetical protein
MKNCLGRACRQKQNKKAVQITFCCDSASVFAPEYRARNSLASFSTRPCASTAAFLSACSRTKSLLCDKTSEEKHFAKHFAKQFAETICRNNALLWQKHACILLSPL